MARPKEGAPVETGGPHGPPAWGWACQDIEKGFTLTCRPDQKGESRHQSRNTGAAVGRRTGTQEGDRNRNWNAGTWKIQEPELERRYVENPGRHTAVTPPGWDHRRGGAQ